MYQNTYLFPNTSTLHLLQKITTLCIGLCRKDLCEATPKMQSVLKFSDVLFALNQMDPQELTLQVRLTFLTNLWVRLTFGQMGPPVGKALGQASSQADHWSDVPPG